MAGGQARTVWEQKRGRGVLFEEGEVVVEKNGKRVVVVVVKGLNSVEVKGGKYGLVVVVVVKNGCRVVVVVKNGFLVVVMVVKGFLVVMVADGVVLGPTVVVDSGNSHATWRMTME